jgi:hypothetical protein
MRLFLYAELTNKHENKRLLLQQTPEYREPHNLALNNGI